MARHKTLSLKKKLAKENRHTRWAPLFAVLRVFGKRRLHPYRITRIKRNWRMSRIF
ncbi:MAG: hypothetical protein QXD62_00125 [Candidatus Woesearchaeota archaeon]